MPKTITRDELKQMIDNNEDFQLVETLPAKYYKKFHLPGAKNVEFDENFDSAIAEAAPDKNKKTVVYCMDEECDASPKAANRMEELGYADVYDYEQGKVDWQNAGLPVEKSPSSVAAS